MARQDEVTAASPPVIALLTDFGHSDPYVGVMKGVILARSPATQIVDLTHQVPPQSVLEGAFLLETAWRYFPNGTVFLVVVDPGVGSARKRLAVRAHGMTFIGPDNGCLSSVLSDDARGQRDAGAPYKPALCSLQANITAVSIADLSLLGSTVSATFEGRDVFAPAAGVLASGGSIDDLGPRVEAMQAYPAFRAPGGRGLVIHVDTYGNLITDIRAVDVEAASRFVIDGQQVPLVRTYADAPAGGLVAIAGSSGFVEIAVANGSAAARLEAGMGATVDVSA